MEERFVSIRTERASVAFSGLERDDWRAGRMDILLVVDNSGSMAAEQEILARDFPHLLSEILNPWQAPDGKVLYPAVADLHVGVVSTDLGVGGYSIPTCEHDPEKGDDGVLRHAPRGQDCERAYPDFLSYGAGGEADSIEKLSRDFGCIARLGTDGCGFEQHLEAAHRALVVQSQAGGANQGFLRPDSILVLVFITDEEDCSAEDTSIFDPYSPSFGCGYECFFNHEKLFSVDRYAQMLWSLRPEDNMMALAVIAGVPPEESACNGRGDNLTGCLELQAMQMKPRMDTGRPEFACRFPIDCQPPDPPSTGNCITEAIPSRRLVELAQRLGPSATVHSICTDTYVPAMSDLAEMLKQKLFSTSHNARPWFVQDPGDPEGCTCELRCTIIEEPAQGQACTAGKIPHEDGSGRCLCVIPQAGSRVQNCGCCAGCSHPDAIYGPASGSLGWWYDPNGTEGPVVEFVGLVPGEGSRLSVVCE